MKSEGRFSSYSSTNKDLLKENFKFPRENLNQKSLNQNNLSFDTSFIKFLCKKNGSQMDKTTNISTVLIK